MHFWTLRKNPTGRTHQEQRALHPSSIEPQRIAWKNEAGSEAAQFIGRNESEASTPQLAVQLPMGGKKSWRHLWTFPTPFAIGNLSPRSGDNGREADATDGRRPLHIKSNSASGIPREPVVSEIQRTSKRFKKKLPSCNRLAFLLNSSKLNFGTFSLPSL